MRELIDFFNVDDEGIRHEYTICGYCAYGQNNGIELEKKGNT